MENIKIFITEDGSPSARHLNNGIEGEAMHHLGGALSETLYIYGPAIEWAFELPVPHVLSVGLGLGYNELLTAAYGVRANKPFYLESFESDFELREEFVSFLYGGGMYSHYFQILEGISKALNVKPMDVIDLLRSSYEKRTWVMWSSLTEETQFQKKFNAILYDLYSSKTTENLWTEEFLNQFFTKTVSTSCALATYAAKGNLKRALKLNGFSVEPKIGFQGKKESIFAIKGPHTLNNP